MFAVTLWEMFTYCEEPWFGLTGRQVPACGAHAKRRTCVHMWNASPPLFVDFSFAIMLRDSEFLTSPTLTVSDPDFVARGAGGRASGETAGLPAGTVHGHEEVLGLQSLRQAQLRPAHHDGCRGVKRRLKLSIEFFFRKKSSYHPPHFCLFSAGQTDGGAGDERLCRAQETRARGQRPRDRRRPRVGAGKKGGWDGKSKGDTLTDTMGLLWRQNRAFKIGLLSRVHSSRELTASSSAACFVCLNKSNSSHAVVVQMLLL